MIDSLDPTHNTVWVGGVDGGLWKTTNINNNPAGWTLVNDYLANLAVAAICQDPRPGFQNIMYFCTGESYGNADAVRGIGVFKSTDAGATWTLLPSTTTYINGTRILCDFQGNVYLGTRNTGLLRSTDGGTTWTTITPTGIGTSVCDLEISSTGAAGRLHVTTGIFSTSGYAYTDNPATVTSATWTSATTPFTSFNQRIELGISGNVLYACPDNASHIVPTIWKSTDGGANWAAIASQPNGGNWASGQGWYNLACAINPANSNEVIVGGLDNWKTTNGGTSWSQLSSWATSTTGFYVHADNHNIQWWDGGTKLMFNCDGGVHFSTNGGTTNTDRNKGLRLKQFYSVAIHPTKPNYFIAGAQDNGMHRLDHPGLDSSAEVVGGDGCYAAIDQNNGNFQFGSYVFNVYRRSINGGLNWTTPINNQSTGRFVNPWDYDNNNFKLYACNNAGTFLRWNDPRTGASTDVVSVSSFAGQNVSAVFVSPYTANRVYFGTGNGTIARVDNADVGTSIAGTAINSGSGMPTGYVNCIVAGSNDQNLIACFTNYGVQNVWVTTNGGTTWTAIDGNLPDMPVRWALYHPDSDTKAYIATETGVWETDLINGAATIWTTSTSFPTVRTDMIKYRAGDRTIAAGTHGRGIFTAIIPTTTASPNVTINQAAAQVDPTSASPINFTVVFDQPVINFATGDVTLSGTAGATTATVSGGPSTYNVAVTGMSANGTVIATIAAGVCTNAALDPNNASTSTDNTVTYNLPATPPTVTINQAAAQVDPTSTSPINFTVVFDQPVTGFATGDVTLAGTAGATTAVVTGGPTTYNVAVSGMTTCGTVVASIPAGVCQNGSAQNNTASTSTDNTVTFNTAAPTVTINQAAAQVDPTSAGPINFTVVFDQPVSGFATGDVTLSGTAGATTAIVSGGPTTYNVAVSGMTGSGTVIATIAAGVCQSTPCAVNNTASTSTDNTVTYNAPVGCTSVNPVANQTYCNGATTAAINFSSPTAGTTFSWVNNTTSIGLGASGNGNIPSFVATNATAAPVTATITVTPTLTVVTPTTTTFNFSGGAQTFTVPAGVTSINFTALGAEGGSGAVGGNGSAGGAGGRGSRATGTLAVTPGQVLNIFVGGAGGTPTAGFNGGGAGGNANSGGGGGASDVRFPGATTADRILTAAGGGGGGRGGCETGSAITGGAGGNGDGNGADGTNSPNGGGGFGAIGTTAGGAGIGCAGFLGAPGLANAGATGGDGGAGQTCCCFSFASVPGGGGGGGGQLGGAGGGGGSAGTVGCLGNDKGAGGGGAGGTSYTGGVTAGAVTTNIQTGNGQVILNYNVTTVCNGPSINFTITVNPTPSVNAIPNQVVCQNAPTAPVNFTGTPAGVVFQWTNNTPAIGLAAAGTGNIPSFIAQNPGTTPLVATITVTPVTGLSTPVTTTFAFTGAVQTYTVPAGITSVNIKTWGAQGNSNSLGAAVGGLGGYAEGNLAVTPGQVLNVYVGGGAATSITGGFNGGGNAGVNAGCASAQGGGGGGASDVRIAPYALANRVIVGAGGGGAGANRVAGCGRGTGGGGGGGYYGGGGGAGWPGIPGSQGPVPTGGTQAAGGAGGITTFSPGPTNGFPGALGVGGAGGTEVGSNQGGSATAEPGGIGGGTTGGSGLYNQVNNWCGQSGAGGSSYIGGVSGGLTTPGLRAGNGQVQITYTPASATTCFGTGRTFTITVNPNANLIIVADPGTTLCEGDPTLLTVYDAGSVSAPGTLYTQGTTVVNGSPSQVFEPANVAFNSQSADDFNVPAGGNWNVTGITANGIGTGAPTSVNVFFYTNSGTNLPGTTIASFTNLTTFTRVGGNYTVTLPSAVALTAGRYWMSFQVNMSFAAGGQWFWGNYGAPVVNSPYAWQNPGGGFATPCASWGYGGTGCNVGGGAANVNNIFSIVGTNTGLGPQSTGTFLWSPAAGLSSTTSNPVAASPQNTTTYTVTRTTVPGGCQASAQVTITVNKRPVVTTQPVSRVNCSGTTATFTVGGTGTGLTYQWQMNTAGCTGGTWVNVPTLPPYAGGTTPTLTITPVDGTMNGYAYRCVLSGICAPWTPPTNVSNCATLTVNPLPNLVVTPPVSCGGVAGISGTALTVTQLPPPVPGSVTVNSGAISVAIPDGTNAAATTNLTVAGIPAAATITDAKVNVNISHTWVGDVDLNLRAPNNAILNLVAGLNGGTGGNAGDNFTNTTFSSLSSAVISGAPDPRTGTFAAEARAGRGPTGFIQTVNNWGALYPTATVANGVWTLAAGDRVLTDVGTITNWSITINYTTPGSGPLPTLSYVWTPNTTVAAGLYTNNTATTLYTGTNLSTVYAAPPAQTTYTVTATNTATGCVGTATALVNYTPPAPTVTPSSVTMCLGDPAVKLKSSSSTTSTVAFNSGTIAVAIPDNNQAGAAHTIAVSGIPANATVTGMRVKMTIPHTFIGDLVIALRAPNNNVLNLDFFLSNTFGGVTTGFSNTIFTSAAGAPAVSSGTNPYSASFRADGQIAATGNGPAAPTGYTANMANYAALIGSLTPANVNGNYTLAMYDGGAIDIGTLTNWEIEFTYVVGVPAYPAVWSPAAGLFSDALATVPYVAGTAVDSVWARPTPQGVYPYQVTVNNLITTTATPTTPMAGGNGNNLVTFNVKNNNTYPVTLSSVSSNTFGSGAVTSTVFYKTTGNAGNPGPISAANGFVQFGSAASTVTAGAMNLLVSGLNLQIPAGATYAIAISMTGATFPAYTNGAATTVTYSDAGCDIITGGNVGWGGPAAPAAPVNNPRNFNGSITFLGSGPGTCTSPARTVVVTVNQPTTLNANIPANQTVCTDKVATFSAAVTAGTGPHSYQWQVSTNNGNAPWTNISNGGVYSGATTATLTITAPPVSMNGYQYRCVVTGAAPCASVISRNAILTVNPLPVIVISAAPYTSLFPGLRTTLSSTVSPNAAATYTWLRNGTALTSPALGVLSGLGTGTIQVDVDGMGDYSLRVTDVNGCTNTSNTVTIKDSASGRCFIYPNPNSGQFQVRYYSVANNVLPRGIVVYDAKGDRVKVQNYTIGRPYDRMDVDMRGNGKGLYWVEVVDRNGNRLTMCRVVIQ